MLNFLKQLLKRIWGLLMASSDAKYNEIDDVPLDDALQEANQYTGSDTYMRSNTAGTIRGEQRVDGTIIVNDESNDRILIGIQKDGFGDKDLGIKVSQEGVDVQDATDDQLIMSSAFNMLKIVLSDTQTQTLPNPVVAGTTYTQTYSHNLGYTPGIMAFLDDTSAVSPIPRTVHAALGTTPFQASFLVDVDSTDVTFRVLTAGSAFYNGITLTYKFYLFRETAN